MNPRENQLLLKTQNDQKEKFKIRALLEERIFEESRVKSFGCSRFRSGDELAHPCHLVWCPAGSRCCLESAIRTRKLLLRLVGYSFCVHVHTRGFLLLFFFFFFQKNGLRALFDKRHVCVWGVEKGAIEFSFIPRDDAYRLINRGKMGHGQRAYTSSGSMRILVESNGVTLVQD